MVPPLTTKPILAWLLALTALAAMLSACRFGMTREPEIALMPVTKVNVAEGEYHTVTWLDDSLIVQYQPDPENSHIFTVRIGRLPIDGAAIETLDLPGHPSCGSDGLNGFYAPTALPDARLGYVVDCRPKDDFSTEYLHMMALDMGTGQIEQLLDDPFPTEFVGTGGFAWNPEMTRGITGEGRGRYISEELYWFTRDSWERVDLDFAQSYGPSWSPDAEKIAFVAAEEEGSPRRFNPYDIMLMDADGTNLRRLVKGVNEVGGTSFSPDGRLLAFTGTFEGPESKQAIWVLELASDQLFRVGEGDVIGVPSWSPDGTRMVTARDTYVSEDRSISEIVILELQDLLEEIGD